METSVVSEVNGIGMPAEAEAMAVLLDQFSLLFAYPDAEFHQSLIDGGYLGLLHRNLEVLGITPLLDKNVVAMGTAISEMVCRPYEQWQADYIALFDVNAMQAPLHPYARLYADGQSDPVRVQQDLNALYAAYGVQRREGSEQPDHLAVQLEFMAYLFAQLSLSVDGECDYSYVFVEEGITRNRQALRWITRFSEHLRTRQEGLLYANAIQLLDHLLEKWGDQLD